MRISRSAGAQQRAQGGLDTTEGGRPLAPARPCPVSCTVCPWHGAVSAVGHAGHYIGGLPGRGGYRDVAFCGLGEAPAGAEKQGGPSFPAQDGPGLRL